ncbi:MAG: SBBP repeat-containing protein [Acidobacteria bacterium]|nr:SBBP repeat-containing protein [Acidobacteriota bacterium]
MSCKGIFSGASSKLLASLMLLFLAALILLGSGPILSENKPAEPQKQLIPTAFGKLPLSFEIYFEQNLGQTDSRVRFLSRGRGYTLFLNSTEAVLALNRGGDRSPDLSVREHRPQAGMPAPPSAVLRMKLIGANENPDVNGLEELPGKSNYFIGNDPKRWRSNVPHYARVAYRQVYPGIDLVYYGNRQQLEYDFVVAPGADPDAIRLGFEGADEIGLDHHGNLILQTAGGELLQRAPVIYQEIEGVKASVAGGYVLQSDNEVSFAVAAYDASRPLIIDPVLEYSSYLGGSEGDQGISVAVDAAGNLYVTGDTISSNFPTTSGAFQTTGSSVVYVTKVDAAGSGLVYSTYLGGSKASVGHGIAVDDAGNAYVTGRTESSDFPTARPFQPAYGGGSDDAFITKLNAEGSALVYSTYLGGSNYDQGRSIAVDGAGNATITGITESANFPTANPLQGGLRGERDALVAKLNADGSSLVYSTYLGGSGVDVGHFVTVDAAGSAYVTGLTNSADFPTARPLQAAFRGGRYDAIVTKLNPDGSALVYSTYLGGSRNDEARSIAVDSSGNAYVTGYTESDDFPTAHPFQAAFGGGSNDAFIVKLSAAGSALVYSTYLGVGGGDFGRAIAVDIGGNAYVTGYTDSDDFPTANPFQPAYAGNTDAFILKLNAAGSALVYSTYLGGSGFERGRGIAVDAVGNAYVTGRTESQDLPTANGFQAAYGGGSGDAFVIKLSP